MGCIVCGGVFRDLLGGGFIALQGSVGLAQLRLQLSLPGLGGLQRLPQGRLVAGTSPSVARVSSAAAPSAWASRCCRP